MNFVQNTRPLNSISHVAALVAVTLFASPLTAQAEREKAGNGGFSRVCRNADGSIRSARLWDFYEAENPDPALGIKPLKIAFDPDATTVRKRVESTLKRVSDYAPSVTEGIEDEAERLLKSLEHYDATGTSDGVVAFTDRSLSDLMDSRHITLPDGCQVEPTVIRINKSVYPYEIKADYVVQRQIWAALNADPDSQAGFVLHEAIYEHADRVFEHPYSVKSRHLNAYVSSDEMTKNGWSAFMKKLADFGYDGITSYGGEKISLKSGMTLRPDGLYSLRGNSPALGYPMSTVVLDSNGAIQAEPTRLANPRELQLKGSLWFTKPKLVNFDTPLEFQWSRDMTRISKGTSVGFTLDTEDGRQTCEIPQNQMRQPLGAGFAIEFKCNFTVYHGNANYRLDVRSHGVRLVMKDVALKYRIPGNSTGLGIFFILKETTGPNTTYTKTGSVKLP